MNSYLDKGISLLKLLAIFSLFIGSLLFVTATNASPREINPNANTTPRAQVAWYYYRNHHWRPYRYHYWRPYRYHYHYYPYRYRYQYYYR